MKRQKILHIVEAMGGGIFSYIVELANGLSDEFDVIIAFGIRNETPENYADYFNENVKLIRVKSFSRSLNPIKDFKACFEVRKIVKQTEPDIIHLHSSKAGAIGRISLSASHRKMFYTPHGYSFFMEDIPVFKRKIFKQVERVLGKKNCMTVACGRGEWEKSKMVTLNSTYVSNGINTAKIDRVMGRIGNKSVSGKSVEASAIGVDECSRLNESSLDVGERTIASGETRHEFTVYTVGRITYQKNPEKFNRIAELLPDIKFLWIGEGDMKEYLTSPNIEVTGWKNGDETIALAMQGDIFILPSRWEGLPISLLEAMYMEKLCIVSDVVGNNDLIFNDATGFVCDTAEQFAEKIKERMNVDNSEITCNAYKEIVDNYNSLGLCRDYKKLYEGSEG